MVFLSNSWPDQGHIIDPKGAKKNDLRRGVDGELYGRMVSVGKMAMK